MPELFLTDSTDLTGAPMLGLLGENGDHPHHPAPAR